MSSSEPILFVCRCRASSWKGGAPGPICWRFEPMSDRGDSVAMKALMSVCANCWHDVECHEDLSETSQEKEKE